MYKKKLIYLSLAALLPMGNLAVAEDVVATEPAAEQSPMPTAAEPVTEVAQDEAAAKPVSAPPAGDAGMSMEERWKEREKNYAELRQRAEEAGVMLPERPPWRDRSAQKALRPDMQERMEHRQKMQSMTPEERDAYRMERYQEMRERGQEIGMEMPETPPWKQRQSAMEEEWAKHQAAIEGMSEEERAACHAMHRRHMRQAGPGSMMRGPDMQRPMYQGQMPDMQRPVFQGQMPGYGYGPGPYGPGGNYYQGQ